MVAWKMSNLLRLRQYWKQKTFIQDYQQEGVAEGGLKQKGKAHGFLKSEAKKKTA